MPTIWAAESVIKEIDPEFAEKIRAKRNEAAMAVLCGPGEEGNQCRKKYRDGEIEEEDVKESITQEELTSWVDSNYDFIAGSFSIIAQIASEEDADLEAVGKIIAASREAYEEIRRAASFAKDQGLLLPDEYRKVAKRAKRFIKMMEEDLRDMQDARADS